MTTTNTDKALKKKLEVYCLSILILITLCVVIAFTSYLSPNAAYIGWGLSLGVPILIGFYAGICTSIGEAATHYPQSPKKRTIILFTLVLAFKVLKWILFIIVGLLSFFVLAGLIYGSFTPTDVVKSIVPGLYCITMGIGVFILPMLVGLVFSILIGRIIRKLVVANHYKNSALLCLLLASTLFLPALLDKVENKIGFRNNMPNEEVLTTREISTKMISVWKNIQFYEDTKSQSALLFSFGFPRPIRTEGSIQNVGDLTRCVYDRGYLVKKVSAVSLASNSALLAFDVIEQVNIEDKAIKLVKGSFHLEQQASGNTKITLATNYKPLMTPRWIWRPFEVLTAKALHNHIVDAIDEDIYEQSKLALGL